MKNTFKIRKQKGSVIVLSLLMMTALFSMIAMSVDLGQLLHVRLELKKAADAASLAGASYLYPSTPDGEPNWSLAEEKALEAVSWNTADNTTLSSALIETGYWDLSGEIPGIRAPGSVTTPDANDIPAVRVVIAKETGVNGGPVSLYFTAFVGVPSKDVSDESVAGTGAPNTVEENTLFPTVLPASVYDQYWDYEAQKPKIDPETGEPYVFEIGADSTGSNGQWTSFVQDINSASYLFELVASGNPESVSIGQEVYLVPGVKTSVYNSVPSDTDVTVALVSDSSLGGAQTVTGFGGMHIHYATGGDTKSITVSLTDNVKTEGGSPGGGGYFGSYVPPKLLH